MKEVVMTKRISFLKNVLLEVHSNKITVDEAWSKITSLPTPWHTKEWKECRSKLIGDKCEDCGKKDGVLVLQHTYQPTKSGYFKSEYYYKIRKAKHREYLLKFYPEGLSFEKVKDMVIDYFESHPKQNLCPHCYLATYRERKTKKPRFICTSCGREFEETIYDNRYRSKIRRQKQFEFRFRTILGEIDSKVSRAIQEDYKREAEIYALQNCIRESIEYCSFTHTKTSCKSCAFTQDVINGYY